MNKKNSRSQKKLEIIPIMLVTVLLTTGAAYAFWYDSLTITGDVTTSDFDVELSLPYYWYYDCEWKDVVTFDPDGGLDDVDFEYETEEWNKITFYIDGAYPGYHGYIKIGVVSKGDIPAHMKDDPTIETVPELDVWLSMEDQTCEGPYDDPFWECWQLHELEYFFLIHFEVIEVDPDIMPQQGQTYTFTVTLPLIQYNYDSDCFP